MKLLQKGIWVILIPLAVEAGLVFGMIQVHADAERAAMRATQAANVLRLTDAVWAVILNLGIQLFDLQTGAGSKEKAHDVAKEIDPLLDELKKQEGGHSENIKVFDETVRDLVRRELVLCNSVDEDGLEIPFYSVNVLKGELKNRLIKLKEVKKRVHDEFNKVTLAQSAKSIEERTNKVFSLWIGVAILFAFCICIQMIFFKRIVGRILTVVDNSRRFSKGAPLNEPIGGADEIADLDRSFREMAATVEAASRRERALIDNAVDVICSVNEFGTFTAVSPAAERVWGYQPSELIGKTLADLLVTEDKDAAYAALTSIRASHDSTTFENKIVTTGGDIKDMQWSAQWSSENLTFFCVVHDISDRKAIERLKQDFVNMISHDLKTPLTAVRLTLELVLKGVYGELDAKGQHRIGVAQDSTQRLLELVNQLLQLEKLEAGKMELHKTPRVVSELLHSACDSVQTFAEQHSVKTEVVCDSTLEAELDADRIIQVVINLVSNAIKFSPEQSTVVVSAARENDDLIVEVADRGRGIPPDLIDTIFDRFKQVDRSDAEEKGGTGLGLAICQAIIQSHDGQIGVDSVEGEGSAFWFAIPIGNVAELLVEEKQNVPQQS